MIADASSSKHESAWIAKRGCFLGLPLDVVTMEEATRMIDEFVCGWNGAPPKAAFTLNAQAVHLALRDPDFARLLQQADQIVADGMSIVWGARFLGHPVPERICTTDFVKPVARLCAEKGYSLYLLGGTTEVVQAAGAALQNEFLDLKICGTHHGYFDREQNKEVVRDINEKAPSIVFVGRGRPRDEQWVIENKNRLRVPVCMTCGGLYKFLTGTEGRAPQWMRDAGLEWAYRLILDPRRMWKRYLTGNSELVYHVLRARMTKKNPIEANYERSTRG